MTYGSGSYGSFEYGGQLGPSSPPPPPTSCGTTMAQALYADIVNIFLEPPAFSTGMVTDDMFFTALGDTINDFLTRTGVSRGIYPINVASGTSTYSEPDGLAGTIYASLSGSYLYRDSGFSLDQTGKQWYNTTGNTVSWREDELSPNTIQVQPTPQFTSSNSLTLIGNSIPTSLPASLSTLIPLVPDSFTPYLKYGVLYRLFSADSEAKNLQKAAYCLQRYQEGVGMAASIMGESVEV